MLHFLHQKNFSLFFIDYFLSIKKNFIDNIIKSDDHKIINSEGTAAASIKSFDAMLNALVEKVSKLNGLNIRVIGNSLIISIDINMKAKTK